MEGIGYLRRALQNYKQFDVMTPIQLSKRILEDNESILIWKDEYSGICIGVREEFEDQIRYFNSDYRVTEDNLLFEVSSDFKDLIMEVCLNGDYETRLSRLIDVLEFNRKLELKYEWD